MRIKNYLELSQNHENVNFHYYENSSIKGILYSITHNDETFSETDLSYEELKNILTPESKLDIFFPYTFCDMLKDFISKSYSSKKNKHFDVSSLLLPFNVKDILINPYFKFIKPDNDVKKLYMEVKIHNRITDFTNSRFSKICNHYSYSFDDNIFESIYIYLLFTPDDHKIFKLMKLYNISPMNIKLFWDGNNVQSEEFLDTAVKFFPSFKEVKV